MTSSSHAPAPFSSGPRSSSSHASAATQPSSCWPETSRTRKGLCTTRAKGAGSRCRIRHGECMQLPSNLQTSNTTMCTACELSGDATGMMMLACSRTYDIGMWCPLRNALSGTSSTCFVSLWFPAASVWMSQHPRSSPLGGPPYQCVPCIEQRTLAQVFIISATK